MASCPTFFESAAEWRRWLEDHHDRADALLVGFHKKGSGRPSIDWPQARDEALCFGWIDGVRKSLDPESYTIRFTPRRRGSVWSRVNLDRFEALKAEGRTTEAGERAFRESSGRTGVYSYEKEESALTAQETALFRRDEAAWADWERRPPGYRKLALHWIASAKRPATRERRLAILIRDSAAGRKIGAIDIARKT
ncbi:MAG TPA: YdeI/OmpD-associated family protein [Allosphingosinicella sp.]|nr:YdeI/OmpD-associated family protein [Allosphingosinicella sp.]